MIILSFLYIGNQVVLLNSNFVLLNGIVKAKWMLLQEDLVLAALGTYISCCFEKINNR